MQVTKVFVTVYAGDAERAVAWWTTVVGRTFDRRPMPGCHEWDFTDDVLFQVIEAAVRPVAEVAFRVPDLTQERDRIQAHGIDLSEPMKVPGFSTLMLSQTTDPAGNSLSLLSGG